MKEKLLDILEKFLITWTIFRFCPIAPVAQSLCRHFEKQPYGRSGIPDHICRLSYFYHVMLVRISATRHLKADIAYIQDSLNTFGLDIAYEKSVSVRRLPGR